MFSWNSPPNAVQCRSIYLGQPTCGIILECESLRRLDFLSWQIGKERADSLQFSYAVTLIFYIRKKPEIFRTVFSLDIAWCLASLIHVIYRNLQKRPTYHINRYLIPLHKNFRGKLLNLRNLLSFFLWLSHYLWSNWDTDRTTIFVPPTVGPDQHFGKTIFLSD
jgi:hypothetical protein